MSHIKYPRLLAILLSFFVAFLLFEEGAFASLESHISGYGVLWIFFVSGFLASISITSPFGFAMLITAAHDMNPLLGAMIAGCGALLADITIFEVVRFSLHEELTELFSHRPFRWIHSLAHHPTIQEEVREYLTWSFAGLIIASPFPDEIGIFLLGTASHIRGRLFAVLCYLFNTAGFFALLSLASLA
jgi:hypothetical protein